VEFTNGQSTDTVNIGQVRQTTRTRKTQKTKHRKLIIKT